MPAREEVSLLHRSNGIKNTTLSLPHPLEPLSIAEFEQARESILRARGSDVLIKFRSIFLEEPPKRELAAFLETEHAGTTDLQNHRPTRFAMVHYDVVGKDGTHEYTHSTVELPLGLERSHRVIDKMHQAALTTYEFRAFAEACLESPLYKEAIAKFNLPEGFVVTIDPWPYGGPDPDETAPRYTQGLCFARDTRSGNKDSNHYGYPLPIIPVMETHTQKIVRIDKLATGGKEDGLKYDTHSPNVLDHCRTSEYIPELLEIPLRKDVKPLNVIQPDGPSFKVTNESLVEWQKWRFRVGFNPREGATLHDVWYDGRSILFRLSLSEMTVPYGDPRPPFHRKQAFDFRDGGAGRAANNLSLGCDCLGVIKYFDSIMADSDGSPSISKNVVCLHEQDNGIGWKHTNYRTQRAVVTRSRELVLQFIITLANYEYVFAYKFDQAGGIVVETRATGIVSVVNIDPGKTSPWGNVVSPGALAQNHQHIFCVRIDPAIDGHNNTVVAEESLSLPMSPDQNPWGNGYQVVQTLVTKSSYLDASPFTNRTIKITNPSKINPISQKPVSYKFTPSATQLLIADPRSVVAKRAQFAQHHVWITKYKEGELWAGGEFTNQSKKEIDGVADAVRRNDDVQDADVVVWNVFGLTHNPRVEDWPVMPVEIHQLHLRPADFFLRNPALDVPGLKNDTSVLAMTTNGVNGKEGVEGGCCQVGSGSENESVRTERKPEGEARTGGEQDAVAHLQGTGPDLDPSSGEAV